MTSSRWGAVPACSNPRDGLEHGWGGAGAQFQPGPQRRQTERHLVEVRGVARPAEAQVRRVHQLGDTCGHRALSHRLRDDPAHRVRDGVERGDVGDACGLERLRCVEDALSGIRVGEGLDRCGHSRQVRAAVEVRCAADGPHGGKRVQGRGRDVDTAYGEGPQPAVGAGVLDTHVQNGGVVEDTAVPVELLGVDAVGQHLRPWHAEHVSTLVWLDRGDVLWQRPSVNSTAARLGAAVTADCQADAVTAPSIP